MKVYEQCYSSIVLTPAKAKGQESSRVDQSDDDSKISDFYGYAHVVRPLVRFRSEDDAQNAVDEYDYQMRSLRNIYAECVPDSELDNIIEARGQQKAVGPSVGLMVFGVEQPSQDIDYIRGLFCGTDLNDIQKPARRDFALVFLSSEAAEKWLECHPKGANDGERYP